MPSTYIEPFAFRTIFVEYFLGSAELFIYALVLLISLVCAKAGIPNRIYLIILAVSALMFSVILGEAVYIFIILIIGIISFKSLGRLIAN
jgi:hypothetical protein